MKMISATQATQRTTTTVLFLHAYFIAQMLPSAVPCRVAVHCLSLFVCLMLKCSNASSDQSDFYCRASPRNSPRIEFYASILIAGRRRHSPIWFQMIVVVEYVTLVILRKVERSHSEPLLLWSCHVYSQRKYRIGACGVWCVWGQSNWAFCFYIRGDGDRLVVYNACVHSSISTALNFCCCF